MLIETNKLIQEQLITRDTSTFVIQQEFEEPELSDLYFLNEDKVMKVAAGIKSPVVFSSSVYQKRLICTNVKARQSLISLFSFCCYREEREN